MSSDSKLPLPTATPANAESTSNGAQSGNVDIVDFVNSVCLNWIVNVAGEGSGTDV